MIKAQDIADKFDGKVLGEGSRVATCFSSIVDTKEDSISFISNSKYYHYLANTKAAIIITPIDERLPKSSATVVMVKSPTYVFASILKVWDKEKLISPGISEEALVSKKALIGKDVYIGPNVIIEDDVKIGDGTKIKAQTFIGKGSKIGNNCFIYSNVTIRDNIVIGDNVIIHPGVVIGSDGFGFIFDKGIHVKISQLGSVEISDDVEIGANSTIDRATVGKTKIGKGTKIDNLVQIAHNVLIGENCLICAQAGIAGSTTVGDYVTIAGQAGIVGHIDIGSNSTIAAQAGVTKDVKPKDIVSGYPAMTHKEANQIYVLMRKLPEIYKTIKKLDKS